MSIDEQALKSLIEESADIQSDAMRTTRTGLADMVEQGLDHRAQGGYEPEAIVEYQVERRNLLSNSLLGLGALAGTAFSLGMFQLFTQPAFAASSPDVQAGQTAASIENLAIAVYNTAAGLSFMKNIPSPAGATVTAFVMRTIADHTAHAQAFNASVTALGGQAQTKPDPVVYNSVVTPALPGLKTPLDVVNFAATLESVAAQTYVVQTGAVNDAKLRGTFASIMGVEAQHVAVLKAVGALLSANAPQLITIPPPSASLPAAAGSVGFPDQFFQTGSARPATEGAV